MNKIENKKLVTVGIPSYNRSLTIARTIESVLNQSYTNLEVLISDDCSPNLEVDKIIKSYCKKDSRITYLKQDKNIGPRNNHSLLVEKASGKYFMWLSDDDYISKDYIMEIMKVFDKDSTFSLVGGQTFFVNSITGIQTKKSTYNLLDANPMKRFLKYFDIVEHNSIYNGIFSTKNTLDYNTQFFGSDWLHIVRLAYIGKVKTLNNISIYREEDGGNSTRYFSYFQRVKIYYDVYRNIKYDLYNSNLYNELTDSEIDYLHNKTRKSFFKYLYINTHIHQMFKLIKNALS